MANKELLKKYHIWPIFPKLEKSFFFGVSSVVWSPIKSPKSLLTVNKILSAISRETTSNIQNGNFSEKTRLKFSPPIPFTLGNLCFEVSQFFFPFFQRTLTLLQTRMQIFQLNNRLEYRFLGETVLVDFQLRSDFWRLSLTIWPAVIHRDKTLIQPKITASVLSRAK